MNILINGIVMFFIGFVFWFFFMKKEVVVEAQKRIRIIVDGGYKPNVIQVKNNVTTILEFLRKDPSSCLEEVVIPDFKIKEFLPINTVTKIAIHPEQTGEYDIHCGMNMFHGKIKVI